MSPRSGASRAAQPGFHHPHKHLAGLAGAATDVLPRPLTERERDGTFGFHYSGILSKGAITCSTEYA